MFLIAQGIFELLHSRELGATRGGNIRVKCQLALDGRFEHQMDFMDVTIISTALDVEKMLTGNFTAFY